MGAVAKFASGGKGTAKKDLALIASQYGHVYVAKVALGAKDSQTVQAFREAEAYPGPALIIAYSHCIAHGYALSRGLEQQKLAVDTGYWPLFRYDPRLAEQGQVPFKLDSAAPKTALAQFTSGETRFGILKNIDPTRAELLAGKAQEKINTTYAIYQQLAAPAVVAAKKEPSPAQPAAPSA
jgi:pyruvate-ferredoxin/flavodoxin oxidoreductase